MVLAPLDAFQRRFIREPDISDEDALFHFKLALLSCRRHTGMRGLIHRCALKNGPDQFSTFFHSFIAAKHQHTECEHEARKADNRHQEHAISGDRAQKRFGSYLDL